MWVSGAHIPHLIALLCIMCFIAKYFMGSDVSRKELKLYPEEGSLGLNCGLMTAVGGGGGSANPRGGGAPIYSTKFSRILHEN